MLLEDYDPNSIKLFSKCARNQASRMLTSTRPNSAKQYKSLMVYSESRKNRKVVNSFDMTQSREQRECRNKNTISPAVGHYNPKIQSKPKLTWDILKVFHGKNTRRRQQNKTQVHTQTPNQEALRANTQITDLNLQQSKKQSVEHIDSGQNNVQFEQSQKSLQNKIYKNTLKKASTKTHRCKTIKSQVNMQRMTGRQSCKQDQPTQNKTQLDLNKSIEYIKAKSSMNYQFDKQLSRDRVNQLNKSAVVPSDYQYDFNVVKSKNSKVVPFDKTRGRINEHQKHSISHSYTHYDYDYDHYIWANKSKIYSNTKTHSNDFKKQTNRILFKK